MAAIGGLHGVPGRPLLDFVPLEERPTLLSCHFINVEAGTWVRVRNGKYRKDLAYVQSVNRAENEATLLLVPRLSPARNKSRTMKGKQRAQSRPHPGLFDPSLSGVSFRQLDDGRFQSRGQFFRGGLIEMIISDHRLRLAVPTVEELDVFSRSQGVEASVMAKIWSKCSLADVAPETPLRIVSGEQAGLVGHIFNIAGDICQFRSRSLQIDVHVSNIRVHFSVGDYVRVKTGVSMGSVGWVTEVEQRPDVDVVTFIDDASMKKGEPKEVRILPFVIIIFYLTFFCRLHRRVSSSNSTILRMNQPPPLMVFSPKR